VRSGSRGLLLHALISAMQDELLNEPDAAASFDNESSSLLNQADAMVSPLHMELSEALKSPDTVLSTRTKIQPGTTGSLTLGSELSPLCQLIHVLPSAEEEKKAPTPADMTVPIDKGTLWYVSFFGDEAGTRPLHHITMTGNSALASGSLGIGSGASSAGPGVAGGVGTPEKPSAVLLPDPVYFRASTPKRKPKPSSSSSRKPSDPDLACNISASAFSNPSFEQFLILVEVLVTLRRSMHPSTPVRARQAQRVDLALLRCLRAVNDMAQLVQSRLPLPNNLKLRLIESLTQILAVFDFAQSQYGYIKNNVEQTAFSESLPDATPKSPPTETEEVKESPDASDPVSGSKSTSSSSRKSSPSLPSLPDQLGEISFGWVAQAIVPEARDRFLREKSQVCMHSAYMHRLIELALCCVRFESNVLTPLVGKSAPCEVTASASRFSFHAVYLCETLLTAASKAPTSFTDDDHADSWGARQCQCRRCTERNEQRGQACAAMLLVDLAPTSIWHALVQNVDYSANAAKHLNGKAVSQNGTETETGSGTEANISAEPLSQSSSEPSILIPSTLPLAHRLMPDSMARHRLFDCILNATACSARPRPEFAFRRGPDDAAVNPMSPKPQADSGDLDESQNANNMWRQLVTSFIKGNIYSQPSVLRTDVGNVTWKTILAGAVDQGAAGLPGPFRQSVYEICVALTREASAPIPSSRSMFIVCPNTRSQTGDNRNKLILNPAFRRRQDLIECTIFGQLLGVAIRSKCSLDLDLADSFWKLILGEPLTARDLASFDYTAWRSLQFSDPRNDLEFEEKEFNEFLGHLTWTTVLSDGRTTVELQPSGATKPVSFADRHQYARLATRTRLDECALQIEAVREGLYSIVPQQALAMLSWDELELRVCGRPTVDIEVLKRYTVYSPSQFNADSQIVKDFWKVLSEFTAEECANFLQFAWARSRLPSEMGSFRMQLNIIQFPNQALVDSSLPTSETCFFNVNIPHYSSPDIMRQKLRISLLCNTITS